MDGASTWPSLLIVDEKLEYDWLFDHVIHKIYYEELMYFDPLVRFEIWKLPQLDKFIEVSLHSNTILHKWNHTQIYRSTFDLSINKKEKQLRENSNLV